MNHVVCVKWGNKYVSQYANVLKSMVKRHTTVPFQFHCLTDDPTGLDSEINVIKLPTDAWIKSWWSKLWMFSPDMPLKGNILFFDLDVVIFDNKDTVDITTATNNNELIYIPALPGDEINLKIGSSVAKFFTTARVYLFTKSLPRFSLHFPLSLSLSLSL